VKILDQLMKLAFSASTGRVCRILFPAGLIAVTVLSLSPTAYLPSMAFNVWDKAQHSLSYAALTFLSLAGWPERAALIVTGLLAHGAVMELTQNHLGWRSGDILDWIADALGVLLSFLVVRNLRNSGRDA
jgi:VanZ family protein